MSERTNILHDDIESRHPVRRDEEQLIILSRYLVDVPDLPPGDQFEVRAVGLGQGGRERGCVCHGGASQWLLAGDLLYRLTTVCSSVQYFESFARKFEESRMNEDRILAACMAAELAKLLSTTSARSDPAFF